MKRQETVVRIWSFVRNYLLFFGGTAFVVTCCILLFSPPIEQVTPEFRYRAALTFLNVFFLSFLLTALNVFWRRLTVARPVKRILKATQRFTAGDFSVRLERTHGLEQMDELDSIIDNLNRMAQELSGVETLRTDFIANVSHELKTPLAVIDNYAQMLQAPKISERERLEYAQTIEQTVRRLSELVENVLKLNKLENQQIFLHKRRYLVNEQLCACMLEFENLWEKKKLVIDADLADVYINADEELLYLVWSNLFSNAIKFTPEGGKIAVHLKEEEAYVQVQVSDTGCGMTEEVGKHIFDRFYQGDPSHSTQGNGLGLALVKRIMDILEGEIEVKSIYGEGSTFCIRLPKENVS